MIGQGYRGGVVPPLVWNVDTAARRYLYVLLSRRLVRALAAAMFFATAIYVVLPLVILPILVMDATPPERSVFVSALVLLALVVLFAAFAALTLGFTYLAVRMLSALATGAKRSSSILLLLVLPATLLFGMIDLQRAIGPDANNQMWFVGLGALLLHVLIGTGLVIGPMELRRATATDRAVLAEPRPGTGIRAEIARLLHLPDARAFNHRLRKRVWALVSLSLLLEGFAFYALLGWGEALSESAERALPPLPGFSADRIVTIAAGVALIAAGLAISFGVSRLLLRIARRCRIKARRLTLERAEDVVAGDNRAPVLFLRSFAEDQLPLRAARVPWFLRGFDPGSEHGSLEEMLVLNLTYVGPVVATGDPAQREAPVGAARWRITHDEWQRFVEEQIRRAGLIVIGLAETAGLRWEVDAVRRIEGALDKTIFVCPPDLARKPEVRTLVTDVLGCPSAPHADDSYFLTAARAADGTPTLFTSSALTEMAYYVALRYCILRLHQASGLESATLTVPENVVWSTPLSTRYLAKVSVERLADRGACGIYRRCQFTLGALSLPVA
jgi:hypothetical protein